MPQKMAITHADLAPRPKSTQLGSRTGAILVVFTILCGLLCFVLCLLCEASRSEVTWLSTSDHGKTTKYQCVYSGSGTVPLLSAAAAFLGLAVAMVVNHTFILIAVSKTPPPALVAWDSGCGSGKTLTWQAGFFFVATWVCFAVAEILLLIGLSVESGHMRNWASPRPSCLIIREGLFSAAGVFALFTVFLAAGLYLTALRAQKIFQEQENVRQEVLEAASGLHASPPRSPHLTTIAREDPVAGEYQQPPLLLYPLIGFTKNSSLV